MQTETNKKTWFLFPLLLGCVLGAILPLVLTFSIENPLATFVFVLTLFVLSTVFVLVKSEYFKPYLVLSGGLTAFFVPVSVAFVAFDIPSKIIHLPSTKITIFYIPLYFGRDATNEFEFAAIIFISLVVIMIIIGLVGYSIKRLIQMHIATKKSSVLPENPYPTETLPLAENPIITDNIENINTITADNLE